MEQKMDGPEQTNRRQATFEDCVNFVEIEARIPTNPSYGSPMKENSEVAGPSYGKLPTYGKYPRSNYGTFTMLVLCSER